MKWLIIIAVLAIVIYGAFDLKTPETDELKDMARQTFDLINNARDPSCPLIWSNDIEALAISHSQYMADSCNYSHSQYYAYSECIMKMHLDEEYSAAVLFQAWDDSLLHYMVMTNWYLRYGAVGLACNERNIYATFMAAY